MIGTGEVAALGAAACWAGCACLFGEAGLRIGSVAVNHLRLLGAAAILVLLHLVVFGSLVPLDLPPRVAGLFAASAIVGLVLGDAALFRAFVLVGPAVATLVMTLAPGIATLEARVFLGEILPARALLGIATTLAGVALATAVKGRRGPDVDESPTRRVGFRVGLLLAVLGATGQGTGLVLVRPALAHASALSGTVVRMLTAALSIWTFSLAWAAMRRRRPAWWAKARSDRRALGLTVAGTLVGPVAGVWLSLIATQHAPVGVAATLMALTPIFVLALDALVFRRRLVGGEVLGAAIAVGGVALLVTAR